MNSVPLVSVVMGVYNGERFLQEAIESVLAQSFSDFEFIIINDGSTDGSATILESFQAADHRVQVYHQQNRGHAESLNRGCGLARGKYIARMDADDIAVKDRLLLQVEFMERHTDVGVLGGAVETIDATGRSMQIIRHAVEDSAIRQAFLSGIVAICHPTVLMRRAAVVSSTGYRAAFEDAEDYDLWLRIAERYRIANLDQVILRYRIHNNQVSLRNRRHQTMSILAAQAAAAARRDGQVDPLNSIADITPAVLSELGVSEKTQETTLARHYLGWIRNMYLVGDYESALKAANEMLNSSDWSSADAWTIADTRLMAARIYWKQKRLLPGLVAAGQAVMRNPVMLARPLKPLLGRFGLSMRKSVESRDGADSGFASRSK